MLASRDQIQSLAEVSDCTMSPTVAKELTFFMIVPPKLCPIRISGRSFSYSFREQKSIARSCIRQTSAVLRTSRVALRSDSPWSVND